MEGLNNVLNELAKLLGVSRDALQGVLSVIGSNYKEVYSTLAREYAIKQIVDSLWLTSLIGLMIFIMLSTLYIFITEELKLIRFMKVGLISCILVTVLTIFGPIFYPNINLVMSLLNK